MYNNDFIKLCPICKKSYQQPPTISRRNNFSEICSNCGIKETLFEFIINKK